MSTASTGIHVHVYPLPRPFIKYTDDRGNLHVTYMYNNHQYKQHCLLKAVRKVSRSLFLHVHVYTSYSID